MTFQCSYHQNFKLISISIYFIFHLFPIYLQANEIDLLNKMVRTTVDYKRQTVDHDFEDLKKYADSVYFSGAGKVLEDHNAVKHMTLIPGHVLGTLKYVHEDGQAQNNYGHNYNYDNDDLMDDIRLFATEFQFYDESIRGRPLPSQFKKSSFIPQQISPNKQLLKKLSNEDFHDQEEALDNIHAINDIVEDYLFQARNNRERMELLKNKYEQLQKDAQSMKTIIQQDLSGEISYFSSPKEREYMQMFVDHALQNFPRYIKELGNNISLINKNIIQEVDKIKNSLVECCKVFTSEGICKAYSAFNIQKRSGDTYPSIDQTNNSSPCLNDFTSKITGLSYQTFSNKQVYQNCPKIISAKELDSENKEKEKMCAYPEHPIVKIEDLLEIVKDEDSFSDTKTTFKHNQFLDHIGFKGIADLDNIKDEDLSNITLIVPDTSYKDPNTGVLESPTQYIKKMIYLDIREKIESDFNQAKNILESLGQTNTEAYQKIITAREKLKKWLNKKYNKISYGAKVRYLYNTFPEYFDKLLESNPLYKPLYCYFKRNIDHRKLIKRRAMIGLSALGIASSVVTLGTSVPALAFIGAAGSISATAAFSVGLGAGSIKTGMKLLNNINSFNKEKLKKGLREALLESEIEVLNFAKICHKINSEGNQVTPESQQYGEGCRLLKVQLSDDRSENDDFYKNFINLKKENVRDFFDRTLSSKNNQNMARLAFIYNAVNFGKNNLGVLDVVKDVVDGTEEALEDVGVSPQLFSQLGALVFEYYSKKDFARKINEKTGEEVIELPKLTKDEFMKIVKDNVNFNKASKTKGLETTQTAGRTIASMVGQSVENEAAEEHLEKAVSYIQKLFSFDSDSNTSIDSELEIKEAATSMEVDTTPKNCLFKLNQSQACINMEISSDGVTLSDDEDEMKLSFSPIKKRSSPDRPNLSTGKFKDKTIIYQNNDDLTEARFPKRARLK